MGAGAEGFSADQASRAIRDGYLGFNPLSLFNEGNLNPAVIGLESGLEPFEITHLWLDLKLLITRFQGVNSSQLADHGDHTASSPGMVAGSVVIPVLV